jgi:hypothetical protein
VQLILGIVIFGLGILWVRGCICNYRDNPVAAICDDLWDFLWDRVLSIVAGAAMVVVGGVMILHFFHLGDGLDFSSRFPFVERRPAPEAIPRPL